jgi:hypothetical protein
LKDIFFLAEPLFIVMAIITLSLLPGWLFARRLSLSPLERLVVAILLGIFLAESTFKTWILIQLHQAPVSVTLGKASEIVITGAMGVDGQYVSNYIAKINEKTFYLSDRFAGFADFMSLMIFSLILAILVWSFASWKLNQKKNREMVSRC